MALPLLEKYTVIEIFCTKDGILDNIIKRLLCKYHEALLIWLKYWLMLLASIYPMSSLNFQQQISKNKRTKMHQELL